VYGASLTGRVAVDCAGDTAEPGEIPDDIAVPDQTPISEAIVAAAATTVRLVLIPSGLPFKLDQIVPYVGNQIYDLIGARHPRRTPPRVGEPSMMSSAVSNGCPKNRES
jgi:hypothetical protein